jgi:hypothetical protein
MATTMEPLVFNALLSAADFLTDVQNELLQRIRSQWQALGFLYLFAAINNAARCAELWADVLAASHRERRSDGCGLGGALGAQLHLDYVSDGFCNLANASMQLACRRIVMQLEPSLVSSSSSSSTSLVEPALTSHPHPPLTTPCHRPSQVELFGRRAHAPHEMSALVSHFLNLLQARYAAP